MLNGHPELLRQQQDFQSHSQVNQITRFSHIYSELVLVQYGKQGYFSSKIYNMNLLVKLCNGQHKFSGGCLALAW